MAIVRKLMSDGNKLHVNMQMVTKEAIGLITRVYHLLAITMAILGEQIRINESRRCLGRHILGQFAKQSKFGHVLAQIEYLLQQYL